MEYTSGNLYSVHTKNVLNSDVEPQYVDFRHIVSIPMFYPSSVRDRTYKTTVEFSEMVDQCQIERRGKPGLQEPMLYLKPHVIEWLDNNIHPSTDKRRPVKWPYAAPLTPSVDMDIFFLRKKDAMHFMMVWAEYIH